LQVVEKWRNWIVTKRPYRYDGVLYDVWKWKHAQAMKLKNGKQVDWVKWRHFGLLELLRYYLYSVHTFLSVTIPVMAAIKEALAFTVLFCLIVWFIQSKILIGVMILCYPVLHYIYM
jgi:hypothetical protein